MSNSLEELLASSRKPAEFILSGVVEASTDLDDLLDRLEAEDIRFVEVRGAWGKRLADFDNADLTRLEQTLGERGVGVSAVITSVGLASVSEPFEPQVARFERMLEIADWLGSSYVGLFSYQLPTANDATHDQYRAEVFRRLERMSEIVLPYGLILLHQNRPGGWGDTARHCADLLNTVGGANLRALLDPASFVQVGDRPYADAYPLLERHITYLHLSDPLATQNEVAPIVDGLHQSGYIGYVSLEPTQITGFRQILAELEGGDPLADF